MRKMMLALGASAMVLPSLVITTTDADAQRRSSYREWKGNDGRWRCRKPNGTTGLVVGGVAGALLGRTIDTRGDRTLGTLGGAAVGALAGREVERGTSNRFLSMLARFTSAIVENDVRAAERLIAKIGDR